MPASPPYRLQPHPASPAGCCAAIEVDVEHSAAGLVLIYRIAGPRADIRLPAPVAAGPADDLWRHTCCEAFVAGDDGYHEFNFSPSGAWAVYRFSDIRRRDDTYRPPLAPAVCFAPAGDGFTLTAEIPSALLPEGMARRLGPTAVIEGADGALGYWALLHDGPRPDFHCPATFLIPLDTA